MKNRGKFLAIAGIIVLFAAIAFSTVGCSLSTSSSSSTDDSNYPYQYTFINNSSYSTTITCSDLSPSNFVLSSGTTKVAKSKKSSVNITYTNASLISATLSGSGNIVTFKNK